MIDEKERREASLVVDLLKKRDDKLLKSLKSIKLAESPISMVKKLLDEDREERLTVSEVSEKVELSNNGLALLQSLAPNMLAKK